MARLMLVLALWVVAAVATMGPVTGGSGVDCPGKPAMSSCRTRATTIQDTPAGEPEPTQVAEHLHRAAAYVLAATPPEPTRTPSDRSGRATYYGPGFAGQPMANGEPFDPWAMTAACNTCELGDVLTVTYSKTVTVTVTDRGDFSHALDLSQGAFVALVGSVEPGVIEVSIGGRP